MKKIAFISQPEYFRFTYEKDLNSEFQVKEFVFNFGMGESDFEELIAFNADYNFFFRGEFFPESVLSRIKGVKIELSSEPFPRLINNKWEYTKDSIKRYLTFRGIRGMKFDYVFHYDTSSLPLFKLDGLNMSGEFHFPVARDTYKSKEMDKKWDFFFIGRSTIHRDQYFDYLKHNYNFLHIAHGVWGPELVDYIAQSKICLNVHAEDEVSWEPRVQMLLAAGAFLISERITPNNLLVPGKDYVETINSKDFHEKAEYYLKHEEKRLQITKHAERTIAELFDSKKEYQKLIAGIESGEYKKFSSGKPSLIIELTKWYFKWIKN